MDFEVDRGELQRTRVRANPELPLADGEARVRVDAFALTSNNITYAVFGDALQYWNFFPVIGADPGDDTSWGRIPVWGFGDVIESRAAGLVEDRRLYGYLPMSTEFVVVPGKLDTRGFTDVAPHRREMAGIYSRYDHVDTDPMYDAAREDQQMLCRPLFLTSFLIDDFLADNDMYGAGAAVVSSASSKTAIGTAFLLHDRPGLEVIGLTSAGNVAFVNGLGCYDRVFTYDDIDALPNGNAVFVDIAGNRDVVSAVHSKFGDQLKYSMVVGGTHWDHEADATATLVGPTPEFFFAPTQGAKRAQEWGQDKLDARVGDAWHRFVPWTDAWMDVRHSRGPAAVADVYRELLEGRSDPRTGHICSMR